MEGDLISVFVLAGHGWEILLILISVKFGAFSEIWTFDEVVLVIAIVICVFVFSFTVVDRCLRVWCQVFLLLLI